MAMETELTYQHWKLKLIEIIIAETRINPVIKIEEIKCVLSDDCDYPDSFHQGETPEDIWRGEIDAMKDSQ